MITINTETAKTLACVLEDLGAASDILDALADKRLEDTYSLRLLSRTIGDDHVFLCEPSEQLEVDVEA